MDLGLAGKAALVTGGSRGIGLSIAESLAAEGARVCLCARTEQALAEAARAITARGGCVTTVTADIATEAGCAQAVEATLSAFGAVDILINNAGGSLGAGTFERATSADWTRVMDLNLMSAVWTSQRAVAWMREHGGGVIVHVGSVCGLEYCTTAPYTAAKAALVGLTKEMGVDLAKYQIRVSSVAPGSIMFPGGSWEKRARDKPDLIKKMIDEHLPWGRFGTPEEIASVVTFMASARATWLTGATVAVDGGQGRAY